MLVFFRTLDTDPVVQVRVMHAILCTRESSKKKIPSPKIAAYKHAQNMKI